MDTVGSRIAEWRAAAGWTQDELAERLGVRQSTVGNWEAGRNDVSRAVLARVAAVCRVSDVELAAATRLPHRHAAA